jgi:hypothetical protein
LDNLKIRDKSKEKHKLPNTPTNHEIVLPSERELLKKRENSDNQTPKHGRENLWMDQCFGILELHQLADIKP